jgi:hypothetical protein
MEPFFQPISGFSLKIVNSVIALNILCSEQNLYYFPDFKTFFIGEQISGFSSMQNNLLIDVYRNYFQQTI